jgi:hypothetical protein
VRVFKAIIVAALATSVLIAGGCGSDDKSGKKKNPQADASASAGAAAGASGAPAAGSSAGAAASNDLQAAVQELTKTSYKYTMKSGDASGSGSVDPTLKHASMTVSVAAEGGDFKTEVLVLDTELYARISGLPLPGLDGKKWLKIDRSKIKSFAALGIQDIDDPTGVKTLAKSIATIKKTGDRSYQGTLDLSKGSAAFNLDEAAVRQLGEKAKAIPFEATVNDKGKLATWKMTIPAHGSDKETPYELTFSNHGEKLGLTRPAAASVTNPPEAVYEMLQT